MTLFPIDSMAKVIRSMIKEELGKSKALQVLRVTDVNEETYTVNLRHLNLQNIAYDNVPIAGMGLGNFRGVMLFPRVDDLVLVAFFGDTSQSPVVIGTLFDTFTQTPDGIPQINENEFLATNATFGSTIFIDAQNNISIKSSNLGNLATGCKLKLNADGSLEIKNSGNFGIAIDAAGNMTISAATVNFTQTPLS